VHQRGGLFGDGMGHFRMGVAETTHRDTGQRIQVSLAACIPQPDAGAAFEGHRLAGVCGHQGRVQARHFTTPESKNSRRAAA
jgi:hypothetical protein